MPIEPSWAELNGYIFLLILAILFISYAWFCGKREEERTVRNRDWEKVERRERDNWTPWEKG